MFQFLTDPFSSGDRPAGPGKPGPDRPREETALADGFDAVFTGTHQPEREGGKTAVPAPGAGRVAEAGQADRAAEPVAPAESGGDGRAFDVATDMESPKTGRAGVGDIAAPHDWPKGGKTAPVAAAVVEEGASLSAHPRRAVPRAANVPEAHGQAEVATLNGRTATRDEPRYIAPSLRVRADPESPPAGGARRESSPEPAIPGRLHLESRPRPHLTAAAIQEADPVARGPVKGPPPASAPLASAVAVAGFPGADAADGFDARLSSKPPPELRLASTGPGEAAPPSLPQGRDGHATVRAAKSSMPSAFYADPAISATAPGRSAAGPETAAGSVLNHRTVPTGGAGVSPFVPVNAAADPGSPLRPETAVAAEFGGSANTPSSSQVGQMATQAPAAPPESGRSAAWQVAQAAQGNREGSFEIRLNPAELGKVRIILSPGENGMSVNIQADRPETLDLLRRHADSLSQDFREMGYDSTAFSFGPEDGGDGSRRMPGRDGRTEPEGAFDIDTAEAVPTPTSGAGGGSASGRMDIRL